MRPKWAPEGLPGGVWAAWGPLGPLLGGLGRLLARSGQLLEPSWGLLGRSWGLLGRAWGSFGHPGGLLLELIGPLLKGPLRNRENLEIRRQYITFRCCSRARGLQNRSKIVSTSVPGASGRLWRLLGASWGRPEALWAPPWAVCVAPGPSLGGSRPVGPHRNPRNVSQVKSKNSLAVKS